MISHFVVKAALIFFAGVVSTAIAFQFIAHPETFDILGSKAKEGNLDRQLKERVQSKEQERINSISKALKEKILPAASSNPILAPVLETKREVEQAVETVTTLPNEQKEAVCKQICK